MTDNTISDASLYLKQSKIKLQLQCAQQWVIKEHKSTTILSLSWVGHREVPLYFPFSQICLLITNFTGVQRYYVAYHHEICPLLDCISNFSLCSITKWSTTRTVLTGSCWDEAALHLLGNFLRWFGSWGCLSSPSQSGSSFHSFGTCWLARIKFFWCINI